MAGFYTGTKTPSDHDISVALERIRQTTETVPTNYKIVMMECVGYNPYESDEDLYGRFFKAYGESCHV